jgi:transposase
MARSLRKKYRPWNPEAYAQMNFSPAERLGEDDLVFFLLDLVPRLDLSRFYASYEQETRGAPPFDPALRVCLLLYSYCVGVYSSRKISLACERNLAFLAIVGLDRPDFRVISDFRKEHLEAFADTFVEVLALAHEMGMLGLGNLAFDGSKFKANASRHQAMSYGYLTKEKERLKGEIQALLKKAQGTDDQEDAVLGSRRGDELPQELQRREKRLSSIEAAMRRLEEQARAQTQAQRQRRAEEEAERQRQGKKRRGQEPAEPSEVPSDKAQSNFTDPQAKIRPLSNKGWDYCGNAQASVDANFQLIVACFVTAACNDAQQGVPLAEATRANLEAAGVKLPLGSDGQAKRLPATLDSGYFSEAAVAGMEAAGFDPYVATKRQKHNQAEAPPAEPLPAGASVKGRMAAKLATPQGQALYCRRKVIVEPVFGPIKAARSFRSFSLRGLRKMSGEWRLVCLTHNLLKVWRYRCAFGLN